MSLNVHAYVCMCREVLINTYTYTHTSKILEVNMQAYK